MLNVLHGTVDDNKESLFKSAVELLYYFVMHIGRITHYDKKITILVAIICQMMVE